jgi:hypothetical protein
MMKVTDRFGGFFNKKRLQIDQQLSDTFCKLLILPFSIIKYADSTLFGATIGCRMVWRSSKNLAYQLLQKVQIYMQ